MIRASLPLSTYAVISCKNRRILAIYDPQISEEEIRTDLATSLSGDGQIEVCADPYDAVHGAHATPFMFDGRNILNLERLRAIGFVAHGVGKA